MNIAFAITQIYSEAQTVQNLPAELVAVPGARSGGRGLAVTMRWHIISTSQTTATNVDATFTPTAAHPTCPAD